MTTQGRRNPPAVPYLEGKSNHELGRQLEILWRYVMDLFTGLPAHHGDTHVINGSGDDDSITLVWATDDNILVNQIFGA